MGATSLKHSIFLEWPIRRNGGVKKCLLICVAVSLVIIFFYYTQFNIPNFEEEYILNYSRPKTWSEDKYLIYTSKCRIPNDNPFNEDVKGLFHRENYEECTNKPLLTFVEKFDSFATLHINQSLLSTYSMFDFTCCYSAVDRVVSTNKSEDEISFSECIPFKESVNITDFIVMVRCKNTLNSEVYSNVHVIVSSQHISAKKKKLVLNSTSLSVLFVGIDSISKMNLVRTMPKTYKFLETHNYYSLKGYTKIGDNTFPNLMAILAGKTWTDVYKFCNPYNHTMNDCDIIWDKFSELGYITAYAEDQTNIGTFNYNRRGFGKAPTDFYFRPYAMAAESLPSHKRFGMYTCAGPETSGERIMNVAKDFAAINHPKFGLFWMNSFSHDNLNLPSSMDEKVESFLKEIHSHLDNTIFIFLSDHGFRFGEIRYTHTGWLEERLPFIYIHLPKNFKERYPIQFNNFITNTKRLTTPYDLHVTLQEVLHLANDSYKMKPSLACPKCHSLFQEIEEWRTCKDGAIDQHWCLCSGHSYVNPLSKIVQDTSEFIVSQVNSLIKSSKEGHKCAHYYLKKVVSSGMSEKYLNDRNESVNFFLIMLETRPPAMFEATVEFGQRNNKPVFRLLGDISRTNRYGSNSKCVDNWIKKYCYCDGLFTSIKSAICNFLNCV